MRFRRKAFYFRRRLQGDASRNVIKVIMDEPSERAVLSSAPKRAIEAHANSIPHTLLSRESRVARDFELLIILLFSIDSKGARSDDKFKKKIKKKETSEYFHSEGIQRSCGDSFLTLLLLRRIQDVR